MLDCTFTTQREAQSLSTLPVTLAEICSGLVGCQQMKDLAQIVYA